MYKELKQQIESQKLNIVKLGAKRSSMQSSLVSLDSYLDKKTINEIQQKIQHIDSLLKEEFKKLNQLENQLQGVGENE